MASTMMRGGHGAMARRLVVFWAGVLGVVVMLAALCEGAEVVNKMSVSEFKRMTEEDQVMMVAGAMALAGHMGMRCPQPFIVGEIRAAILYRNWVQSDPWVEVIFTMFVERGCKIVIGEKPNA
jgi:phosphoribosylamine-glycine ligase